MRAIQTDYAGCLFRSRLEARWAVFFDRAGVQWQYEPQGFDLASGRYLPDFWLPQYGYWFEVKGTTPTDHEHQLMGDLCLATSSGGLIAAGDIPRPDQMQPWGGIPSSEGMQHFMLVEGYDHPTDGFPATVGWDDNHWWCVCVPCNALHFAYEGRSSRHEGCTASEEHTADHPSVLACYRAARSARFEHGQLGAQL